MLLCPPGSHSEAEGRWRPGFIKRVHIENFMRHQNFTVEFGPNVTFISGKNGSGKSATLQALQCCLGVRAKAMGRGSSLKGFIRRGCNSALVMVTLSNEGDERDAGIYDLDLDRMVFREAQHEPREGLDSNSEGEKKGG